MVGTDEARLLRTIMLRIRLDQLSLGATMLGGAALIFGASKAFFHLKWALNKIWGVSEEGAGSFTGMLKARAFSMVLVFGMGILLLLSLVLATLIASAGKEFGDMPPDWLSSLKSVYAVSNLLVTMAIFAYLFKVLPDARIAWWDVTVGAGMTAGLFTVGQHLLGLYLGRSTLSSTYGAAGSFVVVLFWVCYSSIIFLFGAEFTQAYSRRFGSHIRSRRKPKLAADATDSAPGRTHGLP